MRVPDPVLCSLAALLIAVFALPLDGTPPSIQPGSFALLYTLVNGADRLIDGMKTKRQNGSNDTNGSGTQTDGNDVGSGGSITVSSGSSNTTTSPSSASSSSDATASSNSGLTKDQKIEIGVGVGAGIVAILGVVVAIYYGHRQLHG